MVSAIGDVLPIALGVAISPVPVIAVVVMLLGPRPTATSLAFLGGWVLSLVVVLVVVAQLVDLSSDAGDHRSSTLVSVIQLVLGAVAVVLGVRSWRHRPAAGAEPELPGWMAAVDRSTPWHAVGLAALLAAANPKNLSLCLAGGASIGGAQLSTVGTAATVLVFVAIASTTVAVPVTARAVAGPRMRRPLADLREWLVQNNALVMTLLLTLIGVVLLGKGLGGL